MSSTDFTTRARELGGDQQLLLPELAESHVDFGLRMWMLNLRSPRTVETYTKTMTRFRAFLGVLGYDLDGDRRIVALSAERWSRAKHLPDGRLLEEQTVGAATFNQRLAAISSFFTYAIKHELLPGPNPLDRIDRDDRQDYADVAPHELPAMKRHLADIDRTTLEGARDYALLSVALLTGRRRAELVGIRWSSLHFLDDRIKLTWKVKGSHTEHDLLPRSASGALLRFLHRFYGQDLAAVAPDAAVWPSLSDRNYGAPISGQTLADICKRRLDFSAVHQIRHTFAKELEERGVKPSEIQRRLGHQSLRTTTIYLGRLSSAENPVSEAMADDLGIE